MTSIDKEKDTSFATGADVAHEELSKPVHGKGGGDEALAALDGDELDVSEEEYAAVLKKIDWQLTPVIAVVNMIQLVDKNV